jgi:GDP-mannose transporter
MSRHGGSAGSLSKLDNNPAASILAYCLASISMTLINKYVVTGSSWNLHFFYLAIQVGEPGPPVEANQTADAV